MKAIIGIKYGPPESLQLQEVDKVAPKDDELLVKVRAAAANPADWHIVRGTPKFARLTMGLFKPKNPIPGIDVAGEVESVGKNVTEFKPGDKVFGGCGWSGAFAEYACIPEKYAILKPENITFEEGASVPVAAITALQGLRDYGKLKQDADVSQKVLINGASGGVGTFAVQIAKAFGAEVTGVCSTRNLEMVRSIGADHVIDYTNEDFTKTGQKYDLVMDNVGNRTIYDLKNCLDPKGICVIAGFTSMKLMSQAMLFGPIISAGKTWKVGMMGTAQLKKEDLKLLRNLLETGKVKPVISRRYPLQKAPEAISHVEEGHARGKVIITIED